MPMLSGMAEWWTNPEADDSFLQFRERSVRDGVWLSLVTIAIVLVYVLVSWEDRHRTLILVLLAGALASTYVVSRLPAAAIVRSRWREHFFLAWTAADVALIAAIVGADGGDERSVLGAIFFLPLIFGSLSYPARSVAICGVMCVLAYAAAALLAGGAEADAVGVFSSLLVAAAVMGVSQATNRERQRRELARLSRSDPLTGCLNRRGFNERFEAELSDYVRHDGRPLGLIVIDLDNFKAVNDTQGHAAGDALLCRVVTALGSDLRPSDVLARLGGDEFAVLLPQAGPSELRATAERLHKHLGLVIPASLGLASLPDDGETAEALHQSADADLYRSKQRRPVAAIA
jgi:diguanylate cyclase (GGDEF)-like protein